MGPEVTAPETLRSAQIKDAPTFPTLLFERLSNAPFPLQSSAFQTYFAGRAQVTLLLVLEPEVCIFRVGDRFSSFFHG